MYDYGEYVDPDNLFFDGRDGLTVHNEYPILYQKAASDYVRSLDPEAVEKGYAPDYMFYVRSGYSGTQNVNWSVWTGDPSSDWTPYSGMSA